MKAVKAANPDLDIRIIFQSPHNKINKRSKTTYSMWAEKNGFLGVLIMQSQLTGSDESTFLYHSSCPSCGSSDGNSVYSDGHTYCFVCNAYSSGGDDDSGKQKRPQCSKVILLN